jgi:glycosyltransferase involved in cell wall biosynthesis
MSDGSLDAVPASEPDAPRLSIIMPCWNAAATIRSALSSVLAEREVSLECIVIDDGSTDGTVDIVRAVEERDPRVVLVRLPTNGGVSNARNRGLAIARGAWLAFHDADDRMLPGGLAALMRPTGAPDVLAVVGQRIWTDGERTWLSPLYDIPDIREPGRKSIATHPGLLYYASATGKAFHHSLLEGLLFEGRVLGDQAWTIRALLRAGGSIEVIEDTVFEWSRPHPDQLVETITSIARASATGAVEMVAVACDVYSAVSAEIDLRIDDEPTRDMVKRAYFERLLRSDLGGPVRKAIERRDPATGRLFDALTVFIRSAPPEIVARSEHLPTNVLRPPATHWGSVLRSARGPYWRMVRQALRADPGMARRIAWRRAVEPAFVLARVRPPIGPFAASAVLGTAVRANGILRRLRGR